jgi:malonyl-CoA/methylmalonyl-CoA synthetase
MSNAFALKEAWEFKSDDCLLHALPIYHVHGLFVALGCVFLSGSKVLWLDSFDSDTTIKALPNCTVMMGVPTYYTRLLSNEKLNKEIVKNIRIFISGSAPLLQETFDQFQLLTGHNILERYGMTETNIISSNPVNGERKAGTVGISLTGQSLRIVDDSQNILGSGEIGNIQVKGSNVFNGYWNLPEKTKEDFSLDNFFNTGDKGFLDAEGYLTIVGRTKDMIISGGLNVYPKEIESVINEIEGVIESAVIGLQDDDLGEKVVAVVVSNKTTVLDGENIILSLKEGIAGFKVPKEIVFVDELPRNAMGKVQKNILRDNYK